MLTQSVRSTASDRKGSAATGLVHKRPRPGRISDLLGRLMRNLPGAGPWNPGAGMLAGAPLPHAFVLWTLTSLPLIPHKTEVCAQAAWQTPPPVPSASPPLSSWGPVGTGGSPGTPPPSQDPQSLCSSGNQRQASQVLPNRGGLPGS